MFSSVSLSTGSRCFYLSPFALKWKTLKGESKAPACIRSAAALTPPARYHYWTCYWSNESAAWEGGGQSKGAKIQDAKARICQVWRLLYRGASLLKRSKELWLLLSVAGERFYWGNGAAGGRRGSALSTAASNKTLIRRRLSSFDEGEWSLKIAAESDTAVT